MKILAIETATEACSVALLNDEQIVEHYEHKPQKQAHLVLPMVDKLMADAGLKPSQLDAIAFGAGPGSFTGLRIAAAVTQAIAIASDLPVIAISTLAALAQGAFRRHQFQAVLAAIDARMQEVYWAEYKLGQQHLMRVSREEHVVAPAAVPLPERAEWAGVGSGWSVYAESLKNRINQPIANIEDGCWPQAQDILTLAVPLYKAGKTIAADQAEPTYLRNKVAKSIAERKAERSQ